MKQQVGCKVCGKEKGQHSDYCCNAHYELDHNRYSGETIREAIERIAEFRKRKRARLLKVKLV